MAERRVYRGWSVDEATAAYHLDAQAATKRGYVPIDEKWAESVGVAILTVTYDYRPDEVADVRHLLSSSPAATRPVPGVLDRPRARARSRDGVPLPAWMQLIVLTVSVIVAVVVVVLLGLLFR